MPGSLTSIGTAAGTVAGGASATLVTTGAVPAGGKIVVSAAARGASPHSWGAVTDDAGNSYEYHGPDPDWWICDSTVDTPSGTTISFPNNVLSGTIVYTLEAFQIQGVTGTRTVYTAASQANNVPTNFTFNFDSPASGDYFYLFAGVAQLIAPTLGADYTEADADWALAAEDEELANFGGTDISAYRSLWSRSHTGDGSLVSFNGDRFGTAAQESYTQDGLRWGEAAEGGDRLSVAYNALRMRLRAFVDSVGALKVERYNDGWPPTVDETITVESADCTGLDLKWRPSGRGELLYAKAGTVYHRVSLDQGRSWEVADTVATGYEDGCQAIDEGRGIKVVGLYDESAEKWYVSVGRGTADGSEWEGWTTPTEIAATAKAGASMTRRHDGQFELDYTTTGDVRTTIRSRGLSNTSNGTWS